jgi:hypothetical protein
MLDRMSRLSDSDYTIVVCDWCAKAIGARDSDCDNCHGKGAELAPVLTFEEAVALLAGEEEENQE